MSKSNADLFGDDSSSEEDEVDHNNSSNNEELKNQDNPADGEQAAAPAAAAAADQTATNNKDDEKGDKVGGKDDEEEEKEGSEKKEKSASKSYFGDSDSDSDDDDVEFDDKGAVVGMAASATSKPPPKPAPPLSAAERLGLSDDDDDDNDEDGNRRDDGYASPMDMDSPMKRAEPRVENRPMVLPITQKPNSQVSLHITKLPNLIGFKTTAFDPDTYIPIIEEEDFGPSTVHNLVRWRYKRDSTGHLVRDANDKLERESNTRLVEWEDGTWTLHVGSEGFQVDSKDNTTSEGFPGLNGFVYLSQPATLGNTADNGDGNGKEPQSAGTVLECMGSISSRLTARPSSLQSDAHKSLTVAVRQKTIKKARIAEHVTQDDPEKMKQERIRAKSDLEKMSANKRKSGGGGGGSRRPRMSRSYMEDDGDYDDFDIRAAKRQARNYDDDYGDDMDDEEEDLEQDDTFNARRPSKRSRKEDKDDDEDVIVQEDEDDDDDDEEEEAFVRTKKAKKPAHRAVVDDDDSD